jgi:transcriptional regulator with XRE-family HTH domain
MPEKLSPREEEICSRLREARELVGISQGEAAKRMGISRERLHLYEYKRAPLKYEIALRFCRQLIISEEWLATGTHASMLSEYNDLHPKERISQADLNKEVELSRIFTRQCFDLLSEPVYHSIPTDTLFSEAYDMWLSPIYRRCCKDYFYYPRIVFEDGDMPALGARYMDVITQGYTAMITKVQGSQVCRAFLREAMELNQHLYQKWVSGKQPGEKRFREIERIIAYGDFEPGPTVEAAFREDASRKRGAAVSVALEKLRTLSRTRKKK